VGFYGWYATVSVNEQVCLSYTLWYPYVGFATPEFDTKFNSARAFAITANVLGAFAWFNLMLSSWTVELLFFDGLPLSGSQPPHFQK
jgi:hypothetical protein